MTKTNAKPEVNGRTVKINLIGAEKREPKKEFGGRLLASAAGLTMLALVAGCDESVTNNNYGPDGGTVSDASACSTLSVTDRCESVSSGTSTCPLYEGMAAEIEGVIFKAVNIREEGGVKKLNIEVSDRELDCATVMTVVLAEMEGPGPVISVGSKVFVVEVESISVDSSNPSASWARVIMTQPTEEDVCGTTPVSGRCTGDGANRVRCEVAEESALEIDGMLFKVLSIEEENVQLSIHDKLLDCLGNGTKNIAYPASESYVIGSYVYTVTIFGTNTDDYTVDMQVERRALLCGGEEVRGVINVGQWIDSGAGIKVRLDDITRETGEDNHHDAILTILDTSDNEVMQITGGIGDARLINYGGRTYVVSVNETAAGVMLIAKWADISVQVCE